MDARNIQTIVKFGPLTKLACWLCAADEDVLRLCPPHDHDNVRALGALLAATWLYQSALFVMISNRLFAAPGQIRPVLLLASIFIATFILLIDSYQFLRSGWHHNGIQELQRVSLDISGGPAARIKAGIFLGVRIILSIGLAQLTAVFLSMLIFGDDISSRISADNMRANAHLVSDATTIVDADIRRATEAVTAQVSRESALAAQISTLRQNDIDFSASDARIQQAQQEIAQLLAQRTKADEELQAAETFESSEMGGIKATASNSGHAGDGPRHKAAVQQVANAKAHAQDIANALSAARDRLDGLSKQIAATTEATKQRSHDQVPAFEEALAAENTKLAALKDQLSNLIKGRDAAIRTAVENAPDHVAINTGFIAQIRALGNIADEDARIATVILLIDVVSFGFELAAVLAKVTSYVPTTYSLLLARDAFMAAVRMVDDMVEEVNGSQGNVTNDNLKPPAMAANDNKQDIGSIFGIGDINGPPAPMPPKRPRGRPRKYPRDDG